MATIAENDRLSQTLVGGGDPETPWTLRRAAIFILGASTASWALLALSWVVIT